MHTYFPGIFSGHPYRKMPPQASRENSSPCRRAGRMRQTGYIPHAPLRIKKGATIKLRLSIL